MPDEPVPNEPVPSASPSDTSPSDEHPPARWRLPDHPNLQRLRKQAKELRRRAASGEDREAAELVSTYDPGAEPVTLSRAQRVLARAYGFAGWSKLREHLAVLEVWGRDMLSSRASDDPVDAFLRLSCLSYTDPYVSGRAVDLIRAEPALATATAATMAACGEALALRALVDRDPTAVARTSGPHDWPPLLYLCYARLGVGDPVATLRVLLDAGRRSERRLPVAAISLAVHRRHRGVGRRRTGRTGPSPGGHVGDDAVGRGCRSE